MGNLTPWEVVLLICGLLMAAAGAVNTIGSAVEKIVKAVKAAKAPNDTQNDRLDALEHRMDGVDKKFANDKERLLDAIEKGNRASQRALLALLDHGLNGNNINQMEAAKEELTNLLINH